MTQNSELLSDRFDDGVLVKIHAQNARFEPACWQGLRQPVLIAEIEFPTQKIRRDVIERYDRLMQELLGTRQPRAHPPQVKQHLLLLRLADATLDLLAAAGMPIMAGVTASQMRGQQQNRWLLGIPAISARVRAPNWAIQWAAKLLNCVANGDIAIGDIRQEFQALIKRCAGLAPSGVNSLRFLQAAYEADIPWRHVAGNVYQFGWGSMARWLDSSFTDETSGISARLARDKLACAQVLREAGLPVPRHRRVHTLAQAVAAAEAVGYPVVVKPANLDGGRGVFTRLQSPAAVEKAYAVAAQFSKIILVEQHFEGNDYRLQVYKGEVYWVVLRRPAYVTGDGANTIEALIQRVNRERKQPARDPMAEQGRVAIAIDDEVRDWLSSQGLELSSVPAPGCHVRLRGAANVSTGGTREAISNNAHPDNLALAARAAQVMRLDLAGVDLLIPDISRSWRETGAAICEVNSQPQMAAHLHRLILPRLVPEQGRIPVLAIVGPVPPEWNGRQHLLDRLQQRGVRLGWADAEGVAVGHEAWGIVGADSCAGCRALLADPRVDAVVWQVRQPPPQGRRMPVDFFDALVLFEDVAEPGHRAQIDQGDVDLLQKSARLTWNVTPGGPADGTGLSWRDLQDRMTELIMTRMQQLQPQKSYGTE